ncbi:hypothetical protein HZA97_09060 [Candidatus Woesearchaeota archaeon]|nr:hypothetical protein [Candidatus Woesearchaeota archaeon]
MKIILSAFLLSAALLTQSCNPRTEPPIKQPEQVIDSNDTNNNQIEDALEEMLKKDNYSKYVQDSQETELVAVWIDYKQAPSQIEKQGIINLGGLYSEPLSPSNLGIYAGLPKDKLENWEIYAKQFNAHIKSIPRRCGND